MTIMNAMIACLDCGYPSVLTCISCIQDDHGCKILLFLPVSSCFIQDDHEREDRLPGLLSAEGEDEDGRPAPRLRRRSA